MLKSEMQHQYWLTKKTVQRKFGTKEDECIVLSDAELDAKIELFKSINESCIHLHRVIDNYQERICVLAQEENALGKFLKETGKGSATSGKVMSTTGKSLSYAGQQRMTMRAPLLRLLQEVETFRGRAVLDTHMTIQTMERERTEYRAALSWMKSSSAQLDPDSGRAVEKFRKAQQHVRSSKAKFDQYTLDCLQKIDLLAAARCNMFSHSLVAYQQSLMDFFTKTTDTFQTTITALDKEPHYSFTILKELTQSEPTAAAAASAEDDNLQPNDSVDSDQMLFFKDDYKDEENKKDSIKDDGKTKKKKKKESVVTTSAVMDTGGAVIETLIDIASELPATMSLLNECASGADTSDLLGLTNDDDFGDFVSSSSAAAAFMPSQLLLSADLCDLNADHFKRESSDPMAESDTTKSRSSIMELFKGMPKLNKSEQESGKAAEKSKKLVTEKSKSNKANWYDLFADLDPLANPDSMEKKLSGNHSNSQAA